MSSIANASHVNVKNEGTSRWHVRWSGAYVSGSQDFLGETAEQDALAFARQAAEASIVRTTFDGGREVREQVQTMSGRVLAQHERELAAIEASW